MEKHWRYAVLTGAIFCTFASHAVFASSITVALGGGATTNVPDQVISDTPNQHTLEQGAADYGRVRALAAASSPDGNGVAASQFDIDFTLSADALLAINFRYDALLDLQYPGFASYKFGIGTTSPANNITDPGGTAWTYLARGQTTGGTGDDFADFCPEFTGNQPAGTCSAHHVGGGTLRVPFNAGHNHLQVAMFVSATKGGTADGFNTGQILGITVPQGVTFTYDDLSGNPLNVQAAAAAAPEPATIALIAPFALLGILRLRRRRNTAE